MEEKSGIRYRDVEYNAPELWKKPGFASRSPDIKETLLDRLRNESVTNTKGAVRVVKVLLGGEYKVGDIDSFNKIIKTSAGNVEFDIVLKSGEGTGDLPRYVEVHGVDASKPSDGFKAKVNRQLQAASELKVNLTYELFHWSKEKTAATPDQKTKVENIIRKAERKLRDDGKNIKSVIINWNYRVEGAALG